MELANILQTLGASKRWVALGCVIAAVAALCIAYRPEWSGGLKLGSRTIEFGSASTQVLVDAGASPLVDLGSDIGPLATRAQVFARLVESVPVRESVARESHLAVEDVVVTGQGGTQLTRSARQPSAEQRSNQLRGDAQSNRVLVVAEPGLPVLSIYTQAATPAKAIQLADAAATGIMSYLQDLERRQRIVPAQRVEFRRLGNAEGGMVNQGASKLLAGMAFLSVLAIWCFLVVMVSGIRQELRWRNSESLWSTPPTVAPGPAEEPAPETEAVTRNGSGPVPIFDADRGEYRL